MADQQDDTYRLPGVGERISRLADLNPSPIATARATEPSPPAAATASSPKATMAQELSADIERERAAVQANRASLAALSHGDGHGHGGHPTAATYVKIGAILTAITVVEVIAYYIPSFVASKLFVPVLLIMSAVKFFTVVAFYMHLKYDHKLFRTLFTGPLLIAALTITGLLFLFGKLAVRLGLLT